MIFGGIWARSATVWSADSVLARASASARAVTQPWYCSSAPMTGSTPCADCHSGGPASVIGVSAGSGSGSGSITAATLTCPNRLSPLVVAASRFTPRRASLRV